MAWLFKTCLTTEDPTVRVLNGVTDQRRRNALWQPMIEFPRENAVTGAQCQCVCVCVEQNSDAIEPLLDCSDSTHRPASIVYATPAYLNGSIYLAGVGDTLRQFRIGSDGHLTLASLS